MRIATDTVTCGTFYLDYPDDFPDNYYLRIDPLDERIRQRRERERAVKADAASRRRRAPVAGSPPPDRRMQTTQSALAARMAARRAA